MERKIYKDKNIQGITQGSIITGIEHSKYSQYSVWGLVITPRCDLARGISVESVHFLPIVDFEAWFEMEGKNLLVNNHRINLRNKINRKVMDKLKIGDIFESGLSNDELKEFFSTVEDNDLKRDLTMWIDQLDKNNELMIEDSKKNSSITSLIENLCSDKEKRFYLIEDWLNPTSAKVILLREILSISKDIALKYKNGFTEKECSQYILKLNNLRTSKDTSLTYEIQKEIRSPFIEHIMQRFAYNFTRIGVIDRPSMLFNQVKVRIK